MKPSDQSPVKRNSHSRRKRRSTELTRSGHATPRKRSFVESSDKRRQPQINLPEGVEMDDVLRVFRSFLGELNDIRQNRGGKKAKGEGKRRKTTQNDNTRGKKESGTKRIKRDTGKNKKNSKKNEKGKELEVINETPRDETEKEETEIIPNQSKESQQKSNLDLGSKKVKVLDHKKPNQNNIGKLSFHNTKSLFLLFQFKKQLFILFFSTTSHLTLTNLFWSFHPNFSFKSVLSFYFEFYQSA